MKQYGLLLTLSFLLAFLSGGLLLFVQKDLNLRLTSITIEQIKETLKSSSSIYLTLDADYPVVGVSNSQLLDPKNILPRTLDFNLSELRALMNYTHSCNAKLLEYSKTKKLTKAWIWQKYICKQLLSLPKFFFKETPLIHPLGGSFAYRAFKSKGALFHRPLWIIENLKYFHFLEWKKLSLEIKNRIRVSPVIKVLMSLDINSALDFKKRLPIIITKKFVLLKNDIRRDKSIYSVYWVDKFQQIVEENNLTLNRYRSSFQCSYRDGNYCWEKNRNRSLKRFNMFILGALFLVFLILITSIRALLNKLRTRENDRERKDFILKTIAHEIRSPITAARLAIENIKKDFDVLPSQLQSTFLDISGQISRLNSVVEKSRQYLSSDNDSVLELKLQKINSMNEYLNSILGPFIEKGLILNIENDFEFVTDPYWLSVVIKNIVENAFRHGEKIIKLKCLKKDNQYYIEVEDGGVKGIDKKIFDEFKKNESSKGLGLGLYLTKKIVNVLSGNITVMEKPTRFTICLKVLRI